MAQPAPAVLCLTAASEDLAALISDAVGGDVHARAGRTRADVMFEETTAHVRDLFASGTPIIGVCAAGILIRSVAPLLGDKHSEPPVIAVSHDGGTVVPLLGGHQGANDMARLIAEVVGGAPAVTTAGDTAFGVALDAPPPGWVLGNPEHAKDTMATMLSGGRVRKTGEAWGTTKWLDALETSNDGALTLTATLSPTEGGISTLVYHPQHAVLGVGCARNCPPEELSSLVQEVLADASLSEKAVAAVCSLDLKADEHAVLKLAENLDRPARFFTAAELEAEAPRLATPSEVVFAEVGCHGVAEGAALAGAGAEATLLVTKRKSANATCAVALAPEPISVLPGRERGTVCLVGLGPGRADWRTPEASRMIAAADELVGYGFYIDLIGPLAAGKPRKDFPLGGEEDRCRYALERAAEGHRVALICSGDAGIYAMGALVYELMARTENGVTDAARRVDVVTTPGITAMQAAAARIGAPLGHDFCAISLSDLLTPRVDIQRRLRAAAEGDFVTALYNPVSRRRRELFVETIAILRRHRPVDTPVVLASSLGRPDERISYRTLATVDVDEVDMMTVVIIGSSQTRAVSVGGTPRLFTPRGYANKIADTSKEESAA